MKIVIIMLVIGVALLLLVQAVDAASYKWIEGRVMGGHHHGALVHHLIVRDGFSGKLYSCAVPLLTWSVDMRDHYTSCWGLPL